MKIISNFNILLALAFQKPIKYISKNKLRNSMFDIYNIKENRQNYTLEHVIPQSLYKKESLYLTRDLHNLFLYPPKVNTHRSNFRYHSDPMFFPDSKLLNEKGEIVPIQDKTENKYHIKNTSKRIFYPKPCYRGEISRAAMYFCTMYPEYQKKIFDEIIDPYTIIYWHHEYKTSDFERYKSEQIMKLQGNANPFVENPKLLIPQMEILLNTTFYQFKDYDYD